MKLFRTLPTSRLIALVEPLVLVGGAAVAVALARRRPDAAAEAARAGDPRRLAAAEPRASPRASLHEQALSLRRAAGDAGSALMSGATGRLWVNDGGGRLELQSDAGDVQVVWNDTKVTSTTPRRTPPTRSTSRREMRHARRRHASAAASTRSRTSSPSSRKHWTVSDPSPPTWAGAGVHRRRLAEPRRRPARLGRARVGRLAGRAAEGRGLRAGRLVARACAEATHISFGPVPDSDIDVAPPAGAKVVDLCRQARTGPNGTGEPR